MWRTRSVPGKNTRGTRVALGGFWGISFAKLAAHSEASGRVLSAWVLGTRGVLAWHPEGSLGVALSVGFSGTRGEVGRHPEGSLGLGFRDTWLTRNTSGRGSHGLGTRGHVVLSEGFRRLALGVGFGNTWHSPKVSPKGVL